MSVYTFSSSKFRFRKYYGPADRPYLSLFVYVLVGLDHEPCMCQARILLQNCIYPQLLVLVCSQPALHPLSHLPRPYLLITPAEDISPGFHDKTMQAAFSHCFLYDCSVLLPFKF